MKNTLRTTTSIAFATFMTVGMLHADDDPFEGQTGGTQTGLSGDVAKIKTQTENLDAKINYQQKQLLGLIASVESVQSLLTQTTTLLAEQQRLLKNPQPRIGAPFLEMVKVQNAGNAPDGTAGSVGLGQVKYDYKIGKYEVTNVQYAEFLNAVAADDPNGLYNPEMERNARGGIARKGVAGSYYYKIKLFMGNKPVVYVSWYDSLRFCNWLHNQRPTGPQGLKTTEDGAYRMTGRHGVAPGDDPTHGFKGRKESARYWLPSASEWFKAAYYIPATGVYKLFPNSAVVIPSTAVSDRFGNIINDTPAVSAFPFGPIANFDRTAKWNAPDGSVTTVGSAGEPSQDSYKTYDMGGNVLEWTEHNLGPKRVMRGGSWARPAAQMRKDFSLPFDPTGEGDSAGFRVAGRWKG